MRELMMMREMRENVGFYQSTAKRHGDGEYVRLYERVREA